MKQTVEYTSWPLPEDLTQKVVNYLDVYRLIIALILSAAHFGTLERMPGLLTPPFFAGVTLVLFVLANTFPFLGFGTPGNMRTTSLFSGVVDLYQDGMVILALVAAPGAHAAEAAATGGGMPPVVGGGGGGGVSSSEGMTLTSASVGVAPSASCWAVNSSFSDALRKREMRLAPSSSRQRPI